MPAIRASLLAVLALIGLALALDPARAQDPTETATTLHPGVNLIGWTAEPTPTSQLFREIPQLEAIWAWDAELDDWIVAARDAPEWLGGLGRLTPGMGLRMQLGGDQPYHWQRSTEPTRGLVKLRTGWNLVAWSGANETPIDDALKGIGWSLRNVHRWNPATQQWNTWTSPERTAQLIAADNTDQQTNDDSETPTIRRGEALWINVARSVNWLQPTDILPRLVFPGGASTALQARVREDVEAVLNFYRDQYGIQANPDFTIYVAKNVDALIQAYKDDGRGFTETSTRAQWTTLVGWASANREIVIKQSTPDHRYVLTHEYFHTVQFQMAESYDVERVQPQWIEQPQWIVEGMAMWAEGEHEVLDRKRTRTALRNKYTSTIATNAPSLRAAERENASWQYDLGWLATEHLTADAGSDSWIEFWRQFASAGIGPHRRWTSTLDWRTTFQNVFGQTVSEFYAEFDAQWRRGSYRSTGQIRGKVTDETGAPVAGVRVNAIRVDALKTRVGWNQVAETNDDGTFAVRAPESGDYILSVDYRDDCTFYYGDGRLINDGDWSDDWSQARPVQVGRSGVSGINIQLPPWVCRWYIHGRLVGPDAESLAGIPAMACGSRCPPTDVTPATRTAPDGSFAIPNRASSDSLLRFNLTDHCVVYYGPNGTFTSEWAAGRIPIYEGGVRDLVVRVSEEMCARQIAGSLAQSDGRPLAHTSVYVCPVVSAGCYQSHVATDYNGAFAITVPGEGLYQLRFRTPLLDCEIYFSSDGLTAKLGERLIVRVEGSDVRLDRRQISEGMCAERSSGDAIEQAGETTTIEVWENTATLAIIASQTPDGRPELGVQLENGERQLPDERFFPADTAPGQWWMSSDVEINGVSVGRINARIDANNMIELAFTAADGKRYLPDARFMPTQRLQPGRWLRSTPIEVPWPE